VSAALVFAAAAAGGALGTLAARWLAPRLGMMCRPNPLVPQHTRTVAYLGGVGVAVGIVSGAAAAPGWWRALPAWGLAAGAVSFLALGVLDDARPLSPRGKLALQAVAASLAAALGVAAPFTGSPVVDAVLAVGWMMAMVNAVNLVDVSDGLAAGICGAALLAVAAAHPELAPVALATAGAAAGFLVFNLPPASIFLGDAGAHLLGFALAAATLRGWRPGAPVAGAAGMVLTAGVPLFEVCLLLAVRRRKGIPWWKGSSDHFALRLQVAGWSRLQTAVVAWACSAILAVAGALLPGAPLAAQVGVPLLVTAASAAAWHALLRWEVPPRRAPVAAAAAPAAAP